MAFVNGQICHTEVVTNDVAATRAFMEQTFGWEYEEAPMPGSDEPYLMWTPKGGGQGGGITKPMQPGMPPHTMNYLAVDDAEAFEQKVKDNGGAILAPTFEVDGIGKMFVFQEPGGAALACWQEIANA